MLKINDLYKGAAADFSFEVYPPKTLQGLEPVYRAAAELCRYRPAFISVTYGAGGSTRDQTLDMAAEIGRRCGVATTAHLTCVGSTVQDIRVWLQRAREIGIANIMALRGDPPQGQEAFRQVEGGLAHAANLVALLKAEFPQFGVGVAGYPETHHEAVNPEDDLRRLAEKVSAGGHAIFTQLFYDNADFFRFRDKCADLGLRVPIVPGLLPILGFGQVKRITSLCRARLPQALLAKLEKCSEDVESQISIGVDHAREQTEGLLKGGAPGIHYYVLNRADVIHRILAAIV